MEFIIPIAGVFIFGKLMDVYFHSVQTRQTVNDSDWSFAKRFIIGLFMVLFIMCLIGAIIAFFPVSLIAVFAAGCTYKFLKDRDFV